MKLYIRSQDKEALLKVNNGLMYWEDTDKRHTIVIKETSTNLSIMGAYATKERALEVLDEIQKILQPMIKAYTPLTESKEDYKNHCMKTELVGYETTYDIVALPTYVYEMPEK